MRERFLGAPSLLGAVTCLAMVVGCEVSRVPELPPEGGVDSPTAGTSPMGGFGGMQGMPGGGFGGQFGPNPCNVNRGGCSPLVECMNDDGEAVCGECPEGTDGDGKTCTDIDECEEELDECDDDPEAECINRAFGYECRCPMGTHDLETMGRNCETTNNNPQSGGNGGTTGGTGGTAGTAGTTGGSGGLRNECLLGEDDCDDDPEAECTDTPTSYACACPDGYEDPDTAGRNCEDIDECDEGTDACDTNPVAECENTDGSYTCDCPDGYMEAANGHDCEDFDECSLGTDDCDDVPDACVDGEGTFTCECPEGYDDVNEDGSVCEDLNECMANTDLCDPEATCMDTDGGYTCTCPGEEIEDVLGDGHACTSPETRVGAGFAHTCAIVQGGEVKCWGANTYGQLGIGTNVGRGAIPGQTGDAFTSADLGGRAIALTVGCDHNCAILENGDVKCWGRNHEGQLGVGDTENYGDNRIACASGSAGCVCNMAGTYCTAPRAAGDSELGENLERVPLDAPAIAVASGCEYSCALLEGNDLVCWGANEWGQLGIGNTESMGDEPGEVEALSPINLNGDVAQVWGGFRFVCATLTNGAAKCWGRNSFGQLGKNLGQSDHLGDQAGEMGSNLTPINLGTGLSAVEIAPGYVHVCAILDNGSVKCWGGSGPYQAIWSGIGYGDHAHRGNNIEEFDEADPMGNEMGNQLPAVDLEGTPTSIAASYHTCVSYDDGTAACFGLNRSGELGRGNTTSVGDDPGEMGGALTPINLGAGAEVIEVFAAQSEDSSRVHSCALFESGTLKCWGSNQTGELGIGSNTARGDGGGEMGDALPSPIDLW